MELLENYKKSLQDIYDHVGFVEDYVFYPIDDCLKYFWKKVDDTIYYADSMEELENEEGNFYTAEIYTQRFYSKWIYEGAEMTMIFLNPGVDGMKYFSLFDNTKRDNQSTDK